MECPFFTHELRDCTGSRNDVTRNPPGPRWLSCRDHCVALNVKRGFPVFVTGKCLPNAGLMLNLPNFVITDLYISPYGMGTMNLFYMLCLQI